MRLLDLLLLLQDVYKRQPTHRPNAAEINQMAQEVIRLVNIERAKVGSAPLQYHEKLQQAAMVRCV